MPVLAAPRIVAGKLTPPKPIKTTKTTTTSSKDGNDWENLPDGTYGDSKSTFDGELFPPLHLPIHDALASHPSKMFA